MRHFKSLSLAALASFSFSLVLSASLSAQGQVHSSGQLAPAPNATKAGIERVQIAQTEVETSEVEPPETDALETVDAESEQVESTNTDAESTTVEAETTDVEEGAIDIESESTEETEEEKDAPLTESERIRRKLILQADQEYEAGNFAAAEALYRQAKDETWLLPRQFDRLPPEPFSDVESLSPAGGVYWREAQAGIENDRLPQTLAALNLLTSEFPEFVPGVIQHASILQTNEQPEEAIAVLESALTVYPDNSELLLAQVDVMMANEQWIEAAIASRQFVALNPDHEAAPVQATLAEENLGRFQSETRGKIRNDAIANVFTGALGYALTGNIFGPFTAANSAIMLLQGENAIGNQVAGQVQRQLPMLQSPEALGYVRNMGSRLAAVTGRRDLDYEFSVILDPNLNAFALPGGKIFVNAGAILDTDSEAELAGLLAHELSHTVLSHGFQIATQGNLASSVAQYLPYGGIINNVFLSGYSRQMERQADIVGTQILAAGGYAADGVYNVMVTLNEQAEESGRSVPTWISSHPNPEDRVSYLKNLVERGGYNRYAYEGIATHEEVQAIVARELAAYEAEQRARNGELPEEEVDAEETQSDLYDSVERFNW